MTETQTKATVLLGALLSVGAVASAVAQQEWKVPASVKKLDNGLTVVVSEDHSSPTFGLSLIYGIGFRLEPENRTGFAHLFEHMQIHGGTPIVPKGTLEKVIEGGGGGTGGGTALDYTSYGSTALVSALDPVLWLMADRMKMLDFSPANLDTQRKVVQEETRLFIEDRPYGFFYWLDLPQKAFDKFPNAHNWLGEREDLEAATVHDARAFFEQYYGPNNAVLAIAGDVKAEEVLQKVEKYFGEIPRREVPPRPDVSEPPQTAERRATQQDRHAKLPALAIGYRMPPRTSRDAVVGALVGELLHSGDAAYFHQSLVKEKKVAIEVQGWRNDPSEYNGPSLMTTFLTYPSNVKESEVLAAYDAVITDLASKGPADQDLDRVSAKMRSDWYGQLEIPIQRASVLARATLFDGDPSWVNEFPSQLARITSEEVRQFAGKYLVKTNRTIISRVPHAAQQGKAEQKGEN